MLTVEAVWGRDWVMDPEDWAKTGGFVPGPFRHHFSVPLPYQANVPDDICVILPARRWREAKRMTIGPFVLPSEESRRERPL